MACASPAGTVTANAAPSSPAARTRAAKRRPGSGRAVGWGTVVTTSGRRWELLTSGRGQAARAGYNGGQTLRVDSFSLSVAVRPDQVLDDDAVEALAAVVRPHDADLRMWREAD